jgi:PAS domain S-box-containing protein
MKNPAYHPDPTILTDAVMHTAEGIMCIDTDGNITWVNPAFQTMTGYSPDEVLGKPSTILISGEHAPQFYGEIWAQLKSRQIWKGKIRNSRRDGTIYITETTIAPVFNAGGALRGYICVGLDVTGETRYQERQATRQKLEALGTLAGGIAHDFNNILTAIRGYAQLASLLTPVSSPLENHIEGILDATQKARDLTDRILTFARGKAVERVSTDLTVAVPDAVRLLRAAIPRSIRIETEIHGPIPMVLANATQIVQVIINLGVNAALAVGDRPDGRIDIAVATGIDGKTVTLEVKDNGIGMTEEILQHIYEPFFTTRADTNGSGMGIPMVHGIVTEHEGTIDITSEVGVGSRFVVTLPALEKSSSRSETADKMEVYV